LVLYFVWVCFVSFFACAHFVIGPWAVKIACKYINKNLIELSSSPPSLTHEAKPFLITVAQPVKKFIAFCGTEMFKTMITTARQWFPSEAR
jgi:hypothetical protein